MSVFARLRQIRLALGAGVVARAVLWGATASASLLLGAALVDAAAAVSAAERSALVAIAVVAGAATAIALVWRDRAVTSLAQVALWIEEQHPSLEYVLITAVERGAEPRSQPPTADQWVATTRRRVTRALVKPGAAVVVAVALLLVLTQGATARMRSARLVNALGNRRGNSAASRLTPLEARVAPPSYTGLSASTIEDPSDVRAPSGSAVTLRGQGNPGGVVAVVAGDTLNAAGTGDHWTITLKLGPKPAALRLIDRGFQRVVGLEPIMDEAPVLTLTSPAHDSVLRTPRGRIALAADASDDYGIARAQFEYIVSSGEGETFTFKSGAIGAVAPHAKRASLSASLSLEALGLKPGDIVHVRAIASDDNTVTGPGLGTSETRTIRIARADEYDSVAVEAAAPSDAAKDVISERMLITLADALVKKQASLPHPAFVNESRSIAVDQKKLRRQVGDVVFSRLGGNPSGEEQSGDDTPQRAKNMQELLARADSATNLSQDPIDFGEGESPVVAVNKPLLEAYNAMWDAGTSLDIGEPAAALPDMRRALAAIERARQAERLYLRGQPPPVVVDVAKVRLQGKDKGASSVRRPETTDDAATRARDARFMRIVELTSRDPRAAADSLLVLRIDALADNAPFASALADAASALRAGRGAEATLALVRARRVLAGAPAAHDSLGRWSIVP